MLKRGKLLALMGSYLLLLFSGRASAQCTGAFSANTVLCVGDTLRMTSVMNGSSFTSNWTYGDGGTDTGIVVEHIYASRGVYAVSHKVQNAACFQVVWDTIHVMTPPQVSFSADNDCSDDQVHLYGLMTADSLDTLSVAEWYSGAGDTLMGDTVQVVYPGSGYYTVQVNVNGLACSSAFDSLLFINQRPQADFSFGNTLCLGDSLTMTYTGSAYKPTYLWNFGDVFSGSKNTDSVANPRHRFSQAGTYSVRLVITDTLSCRDTITKNIKILQPASAGFDYSNVCTGAETQFTQNSSLDASDTLLSYFWDFGDGDTSYSLHPTHVFGDSGNYVVRLIVQSTGACIDTLDRSVRIHILPDISLDKDSVCAGTSVNYQLVSSTFEIASYLWNFGDGFTSTSPSPAHQYTASGSYQVRLRATYTEGKTCFSPYDSVYVMSLPSAHFVIDNDTLCFKGNSVCVRIVGQSSLIKTRRVLFDDGFVDVDQGPLDTLVCHSYTDVAGGSFFIAVQMLDSNGCSQSISSDTAVLIYPIFDTDFSQNTDAGCFQTEAQFTNLSNQAPPEVEHFFWDFGDGTRDSSNFFNPTHIYTANGSYTVKFWARNQEGCIDSVLGGSSVVNTSYAVDARIDSVPSPCANNNRVYAHQTFVSGGADIRWNWMDGDTGYTFNTVHFYELPGIYHPRVTISLNGCDSTVFLDTVMISGPDARFSFITNRHQCQVDDTVYVGNGSSYFMNAQHGAFWDFGDPFAPACTTNYLAGINQTGNCRFSTDSLFSKHMYDRNAEGCYMIRLIAYDSVSGCGDTAFEFIALTPPDASPDSGVFFSGLQTISSQTCLGPEPDKAIELSLVGTEPACGREFYWVMWDSACAAQSGNFNAQWQPVPLSHNYQYGSICDPAGYVTLGLIIQNGNDSLGNVCRDTAWYHKKLQFDNMDPAFESSYQPDQYYCKGSTFDFYLSDTEQDSVSRVVWDWGDGTFTDTPGTDTVQHTYTASGSYQVINSIFTANGCQGSDTFSLNIGLSTSLNFSQNQICVGDSFRIIPQINYLGDGYPYWNDPSRIAAGKESIRFDIGDGNGFQDLGTAPWVLADQVKNFALTVALEDSLGCKDSIYYNDSVRVYGVYAEFSTQLDTFLCPQAIPFTNLSTVFDSLAGMAQAGDALVSFLWTFDPLLAPSSLEDPERFLSTGNYSVKLKVTNTIGCRDSVTHDVAVIGPVPFYTLSGDSTGCSPLRITFQNESSFAGNYVWQFNDSANSVLSTTADTAFFFEYPKYGNYVATLTAQGSFDQNGIPITCSAVFPDSTSWDSLRMITVHETPVADFSFFTDCANKSSTFENLTSQDTDTSFTYLWEFGDGDTSSEKNPVHIYADTGHYSVVLHSYSLLGCDDTVTKEVVIAPNPVAWFSYNESCLGTTTLFNDSTEAFNDQIYDWQWTFGDGASSVLEDPFHLFGADSTYEVELIVTNIGGCRDSVSRNIRIHSFPTAGFSAPNECVYDSVVFVPSATSSELPLSYLWDLGDGNTSTDSSPVHLYASSANMQVSQRVETPWGCADSTEQTVSVYAKPSAAFTINDPDQCLSYQAFQYDDAPMPGLMVYTVYWDFGDGSTDSGVSVTHSYDSAGTYALTQTLISIFNCSDTAYDTVTVFPAANAGFIVDDAYQCQNENAFAFSDTSLISSGSINRTWHSGDGQTSTDSVFTHSYSDTGGYEALLVLLSSDGCLDTVSQFITVNPSPLVDFSTNDSTQCLTDNLFVITNLSTVSKGSISFEWSFGDGNDTTIEHPSHSYTLDSSWTVRLVVSSDSLCRDTLERETITYPMPVADFTIDDSAQCLAGNDFTYTNQSLVESGTLSYRWFFGDADSSNAVSPSHTYVTEGVYPVLLIASSGFGCGDTLEKENEVYPMPQGRIGLADSTDCFRDHVFDLHDSSSLSVGTWTRTWTFGDGQGDTAEQLSHSYSVYGDYIVQLRVESEFTCADSVSRLYTVYPQAATAFDINDTLQCFLNHSFVFTNNSSVAGGGVTNAWDFGDGNSSTALSPSHSYNLTGVYTVGLIANTTFGCGDTAEKNVEVKPMPQSRIGIADSVDCFRDHLFVLHDSGSISDGTYTRVWNFGDGGGDTARQLTHSYAADGSYVVRLRLESAFGCTDSTSRVYTVHPQADANFSINDSLQCFRANSFVFSNLSVVNGGGSLRHTWDFGDASGSNALSPSHTYALFGDYTVRLISTTIFSCADTIEKDLRIDPSPIARIWLNDSGQCINAQSFQFRDSSTLQEGTWSVQWYFGDGLGSLQEDIVHTYLITGNATSKLVVISDKNCGDSAQLLLEVFPKPVPAFTINDSAQCENTNNFVFSNGSSLQYGTMSYDWSWGDGASSNLMNPSYTYSYQDTFEVELKVTSNQGCADSIERTAIAFPKPRSSWTINDTAQCINTNDFQFQSNVTLAYGNILHYFWDLENAIDTGDLDTARTYASHGTYPVWFYAQSELNCWDTLSNVITVHPKPFAAFSLNDSDQCVNTQDFVFTNATTLSAGSLTYQWDFGDGDGSTDFEPLKSYLLHDSVVVILYAQSDLACFDTTSHELIIFPKPTVDFTINDSDQCVNGNYFTFTNGSAIDYGILSYLWDLGNGETATMADTAMVYAVQNNYLVQLKAVSDVGCSDSLQKPLIVYPKPNPGFTTNDFGQCINTQDFQFTDESTIDYGNLHYTWRFGDLSEDTLSSPEHFYTTHGIFPVRQVLRSDYGCLDSIEKNIQVLAKPTAGFTINDSTQCVNTQDFRFTNTSTIVEGSLQNIAWDFDEGNTATGSTAQNFFPNPGTYSIELIVQSDSSCYDTLYKGIRVFPKPIAAFDYNDSAQCLSGNLYDVHSLSFDSSGINQWRWTIDVDSFAADSSFSYHFKIPGAKYIIHRVRGNDGCWDTVQRNVFVKPMPDPTFTGLLTFHCDDDPAFALQPVVPGGDFRGKNIVNQLYEPRILWEDTVQYWVEVNGCADSSTQYTQVYPFPKIDLGDDTTLCKSEFLDLDVSFWGSEYVWQDKRKEPIYRITGPGTYRASVINICGIVTDSFTVSFLDDICRLYVPTAFTPNGDVHHQRYKPVFFNLDKMDYYIYTRWGEMVYQGNIKDEGWDGTYQGVPVADGVFVVLVRYQYTLHGQKLAGTVNGTVTLIR